MVCIQDGLRDSPTESSPIDTSPSQAQSPEVSSNPGENEVQETVKNLSEKSSTSENRVQETVKSLSEKLSAALLDISAKEDLVKQHSKVAEEAVSGKHPQFHTSKFLVKPIEETILFSEDVDYWSLNSTLS